MRTILLLMLVSCATIPTRKPMKPRVVDKACEVQYNGELDRDKCVCYVYYSNGDFKAMRMVNKVACGENG